MSDTLSPNNLERLTTSCPTKRRARNTRCCSNAMDDELVGMLHRGDPGAKRGIVIVVAGGPQYRAGAHRQFVSLARRLAARGYPVLRFDLRGMGDSGGSHLGYQHSEPDIRAAIDTLTAEQPEVDEVVLFGECESASGILFYAYQDHARKGNRARQSVGAHRRRPSSGHPQALLCAPRLLFPRLLAQGWPGQVQRRARQWLSFARSFARIFAGESPRRSSRATSGRRRHVEAAASS